MLARAASSLRSRDVQLGSPWWQCAHWRRRGAVRGTSAARPSGRYRSWAAGTLRLNAENPCPDALGSARVGSTVILVRVDVRDIEVDHHPERRGVQVLELVAKLHDRLEGAQTEPPDDDYA